MSTLINKLKQNKIPGYISKIACEEMIPESLLIQNILKGYVVIPKNNQHSLKKPIAIGKNCRIKVNANIGSSPVSCDFDYEYKKLQTAIQAGADTIMDLSIAGDNHQFRRRIIKSGNVILGTVPIYDTLLEIGDLKNLNIDHFLQVMEHQAKQGVDFMTIHAGIQKKHLSLLNKRTLEIVSRGGSILVRWMRYYNRENFLYEYFDKILNIAKEYDITLSLGDGLRPGCIADANDKAQFGELKTIGELVQQCRDMNVQVIVEGPGHVPLHLIKENVKKEKIICDGAPFYVLGPLVLDYAPGYDHITAAIGGALAGMYGADFLCYVTPAEHLRLPSLEDVHDGVIASKIAAGAADLSHNHPESIKRNLIMSKARRNFNWKKQREMAIDKDKFSRYLELDKEITTDNQPCSMCGEWCALKRE